MNAMQVRALMHELMDENPFAIRAVLRILSVEFTNAVPTLAVDFGFSAVLWIALALYVVVLAVFPQRRVPG